jgi:signal peptide peptidase SppA
MNPYHAGIIVSYRGSVWLADGERFQRFIQAALLKPCPSEAQIRDRHKELLQLAKDLPALAMQGSGKEDPVEKAIARWEETGSAPKATKANAEAKGVRAEAPRAVRAIKGKVGVIPIYGPLDQRMTSEMEKSGGTPLNFVSAALDSLLGNVGVGAIVLRFNSPGGSVDGVQELSDKIYEARSVKPIYAIADSCAASAALWLASSASMFISTPGGGGYTVGSHGVYVMHVDQSGALEKEGVKVTLVSVGKYKTELNPYEAPSEEAMAAVESMISGVYDNFTAALKRNRNTSAENVRKNFGEGRMLTSERALSVGLIDRIMSYEDLIEKLTGGGQSGANGTGPSAEVLRLRHEHLKRTTPV